MDNKFITDEFEENIKIHVIRKTYPRLNHNHQDILGTYLYGLIQMIAISYGFYQDISGFVDKLKQNSYKDLRWLLTYLIPYVNQTVKSVTELTDLSELYTLRYDMIDEKAKKMITDPNIENINFISPKYVFSNLQYNRCIRGNQIKSIEFKEKHLTDNYYLLLDTILTSRYKLYINWIDILPFRIDNYKESVLYIETKEKISKKDITIVDPILDYPIDKCKNNDTIGKLMKKLKGLTINDIYNTISLDLYESIVKYKWLLFDVGITLTESISGSSVTVTQIKPIIHMLDYILPINDILQEIKWDKLADSKTFNDRWNNILTIYENNESIKYGNVMISSANVKLIIRSMIVFFDKVYSKTDKIKNYTGLDRKQILENTDMYDEVRMRDVSDEMVIRTIKTIKSNNIYDFLLETIIGFKKTWYSYGLLNSDKTKISDNSTFGSIRSTGSDDAKTDSTNINSKPITYKNIYNFCKSFIHVNDPTIDRDGKNDRNIYDGLYGSTYRRLGRTWEELIDEDKNRIIERINDSDNKWFNIRINVSNVLKILLNTNVIDKNITKNYMDEIYVFLRNGIVDIIFESMITKGILSYMVADNELTDNRRFNISDNEQKKSLISEISKKRFYSNNPYGDNSYYYLTDKPFNQTGVYYTKITSDAPDYYDYFKTCSTVDTAWYISTTFLWIAQIGFCHRFINNRINYVTGGTGAGKSTQVPKMYMYYLKAIDRIPDGTVMVTVPRKNVASGVSKFVSKELALTYDIYNPETKQPITYYDENTDKNIDIRQPNYYVQFKYMGDSHMPEDDDIGIYPKIKYITDGSVLVDTKDPLFVNKFKYNNTVFYGKKNKCDVVIIDEAHEHNANMDMILSLIRNCAYYNNQVRIVIMSATMDLDEAVYRRFYRDVNDNLKYPLHNWIKKHKIDRNNTERRFHISPPDETTRFKIEEIYAPGEDPVNVTLKIIKESYVGDILLFQPGIREIKDTIFKLNSELPANVIAIPYHAQLPKHCSEFIGNIHDNLKLLHIDRNDDISLTKSREELMYGENKYTRCVIVATNIAEASISIKTLKYVVETGLEKTMKFDFEKRANTLLTNYITESSRTQRRGRVGRTSPGTVYYLYKKGSLENNVKQFNISIQDITYSVMLDMLRDPSDSPILTYLLNAIVGSIDIKAIMNLFKKYDGYKIKIKSNNKNENDKNDITEIKFTKNDNNMYILSNSNINNLILVDYVKHLRLSVVYPGTMKYIESIQNFVKDRYFLSDGLYGYYGDDSMYDYQNAMKPYNIYDSGFDIKQLVDNEGRFYIVHPDELVIIRNIVGNVVSCDQRQVMCKSKIDSNLASNIESNISKMMISNKIIVFWETLINGGFVRNINNKLKISELGECMKVFYDELSELKEPLLVKILFYGYSLSRTPEELDNVLGLVSYLSEFIKTDIMKVFISIPQNIINDSLKNVKDKTFGKINGIRKSLEKKYALNIKNTLCGSKLLKSELDIIIAFFQYIKNIIHDPNQKEYAEQMGINMNSATEMMKTYQKTKTSFAEFIKTNNDKLSGLKNIMNEYRMLIDKLGIDLIKGIIMMSKPYDIKRKIDNTTSLYLSVYNPTINSIVSLPPNKSFIDPMYYQKYILNVSENLDFDTIGIIINITENDMMLLANIYNMNTIDRKYSQAFVSTDTKTTHLHDYRLQQYSNSNINIDDNDNTGFDMSFIKQYTVPDHAIGVANINHMIKSIYNDIKKLRSSNVFNVMQHMGIVPYDYIKNINKTNN